MSEAILKTTVYLVESDYRRLKALARQRGVTAADRIREAVRQYARSAPPRHTPRSLGARRSGRHDLSERAEELLAGLGADL